MHDRDITLKLSASIYDAPESAHVFDTETRSSMSDSVSSLGISTHAFSPVHITRRRSMATDSVLGIQYDEDG